MLKRWVRRIAFLMLVLNLFAGERMAMASYESPKYEVLKKDGAFEIRQYAPYLVAQVKVSGERGDAANEAFRILAGYIFGKNEKSGKLDMTSPVTQTQNEKIAMTAPVAQTSKDGEWTVQFMMPSSYRLDTLPKPFDARIALLTEPAKKTVAIRFSGTWGQRNLEKHKKKLLEYVQKENIAVKGEAIYAFYNAPFMPPFLRRNEIAFVCET